ncbi:ArsR/SmtB family transcription factor [Aureivirga sp. CE67]|uniref:ArsR/SmtB family transcription factor n=1 Tax=Aureivirga sp. CE67 TaxID=1788983 RepID=UPI0018CB6BDA|nr:metalloregulator ArsR/SmtB family transcription factor [Aureivirga sp. CE67]
MGTTKTQVFTDKQNELANILKVLGHPARLAILEQIANQDECICNDFVLKIDLAQATISQHLKELKKIEIIQGTISGKKMSYCINQKKWNEVQTIINQFFKQDIKTKSCSN